MPCQVKHIMSEKTNEKIEKDWKKLEQDEMKEDDHQLELKEGYQQDEEYEESQN